MSNPLFGALRKVTSNVLKSFGVEVTFTRSTETGFNIGTGEPTFTTTTFVANGIKSFYDKKEINETSIVTGDIKLLIENPDTVPAVGDKAAINGSAVQRVMSVKNIAPSEEDIAYVVQLRI